MHKQRRIITYIILVCFSFQSAWAMSAMGMSHPEVTHSEVTTAQVDTDHPANNALRSDHSVSEQFPQPSHETETNGFSHEHFNVVSSDCCDMCVQTYTTVPIYEIHLDIYRNYRSVQKVQYHTHTSLPPLPPPIS